MFLLQQITQFRICVKFLLIFFCVSVGESPDSFTSSTNSKRSRETFQLLEQFLLERMGMTSIPTAKAKFVAPAEIPQVLEDFYDVSNKTTDSTEDAASISIFWPKVTVETQICSPSSAFADELRPFNFNLSGFEPDVRLRMAEFRFYLKKSTSSTARSPLKLQLFEVIRNHNVLLDSADIYCDVEFPMTAARLDATFAALRWQRSNMSEMMRLQLKMIGDGCEMIEEHRTANSPKLYLHTENRFPKTERSARNRRNSHRRRRRRKGRHGHKASPAAIKGRIRPHLLSDLCSRHRLKVVVSEVGWDHWILAPDEFEVFYCAGSCPPLMPDYLNATNHAIMQSLVHSVKPTAVPPPCCVPTGTAPITLLYLNEYDNVKLRSYDNMVVTECGCR